jgi:hypothetical protein
VSIYDDEIGDCHGYLAAEKKKNKGEKGCGRAAGREVNHSDSGFRPQIDPWWDWTSEEQEKQIKVDSCNIAGDYYWRRTMEALPLIRKT